MLHIIMKLGLVGRLEPHRQAKRFLAVGLGRIRNTENIWVSVPGSKIHTGRLRPQATREARGVDGWDGTTVCLPVGALAMYLVLSGPQDSCALG